MKQLLRPWGRRRNPANWADYNVPAPRLIARGYTGHEHLDGFGLINMNGRMYDPVIGRILSPDNFVQDPTNTQSYNRYSYCLNNPLRYTDPSGWFAAAADQYWNMGKDITDFISFSGRRASSLDGAGGGGQGWGGNGGVLPAWYGGGNSAGQMGFRHVGGGVYIDVATGDRVDYNTVYSEYIVPNSVNYYGCIARNFVKIVNNLGQYSLSVEGKSVVVGYQQTSDLLASNDYSAPATGLKTGTQCFSGTLGALTLEGDHEGKEGPGLGMSGAIYRGYVRLDAILDLSTNSLAGYDLNISASFISGTEESLSGKVDIIHNGYTNSFKLSPNKEGIKRDGYNEIGSLSFPLSPNTFYLHVEINISLILNGGTFNNRTYDTYGFDF